MSALRDFAKDLGFRDVRTILQSGNLVFEAERQGAKGLENLLESKAKTALRLATDFFVRSAKDWKVLVEKNPFPDEAERTPGRLIVMFLKHSPNPSGLKALRDAIRGPEVVEIVGKQAYIVYPDGIGQVSADECRYRRQIGHSFYWTQLEYRPQDRCACEFPECFVEGVSKLTVAASRDPAGPCEELDFSTATLRRQPSHRKDAFFSYTRPRPAMRLHHLA